MSNNAYHLTALHQRVDDAISLELAASRPNAVRLLRLRATRMLLKKPLASLTWRMLVLD